MAHNLMPPYSIDCPVWIDIRALDSVEPREAMAALHEPLLRAEESPLNEATIDTSVIATMLTFMMAGFAPGLIGETVHESHPDSWRTMKAQIQMRKALKLNQVHKNDFSKNQMYYCANNTNRKVAVSHPGTTSGIAHRQSSWVRLSPKLEGDKVGMKHPFEELVPVIMNSHTWFENRLGRAGAAILGDPRIGITAHIFGMVYYACRQYAPWSFNGFNADFPWRAVPAVINSDADLEKYQVYFPVDIFKNKDGSWMTYTDVYGRTRELRHERQYASFAEAGMAMAEDSSSGALEIKMEISSRTITGEPHPIMKRALAEFEGRRALN